MFKKLILSIIILFIIVLYIPHSFSLNGWDKTNNWHYGFPIEGFRTNEFSGSQGIIKKTDMLITQDTPIIDFPKQAEATLYDSKPYSLLDFASPSLSNISSQSCYDKDFEQTISKTGSYRSLTNNYLHSSPDNCSTLLHELVSFYPNN